MDGPAGPSSIGARRGRAVGARRAALVTTATVAERPTGVIERDRIRSGIRYCALVFLGVRLLVFAIGLVSVGPITGLDPVSVPGWRAPGPASGWQTLFT